MKWYSHPTYKAHQENIKLFSQGVGRYYKGVIQVANTFNREYPSIGILDINDLISAGNIGLLEAWNKIDWEEITNAPEPDAKLWKFLKIRIKGEIRREIDRHSSFINLPINKQEQQRKMANYNDPSKVFVSLFPNFFDTAFPDYSEEMRPWDQEQLGDLLDDIFTKYIKDHKHQEILKLSYGIDTIDDRSVSVKELAKRFNMSEIGIKKIRSRSIDKLNNEDVQKIIENFYEN